MYMARENFWSHKQTLKSDLLKDLDALAGLDSLHRGLYRHTNDSLLVAF